jgi:hypothetical protein
MLFYYTEKTAKSRAVYSLVVSSLGNLQMLTDGGGRRARVQVTRRIGGRRTVQLY